MPADRGEPYRQLSGSVIDNTQLNNNDDTSDDERTIDMIKEHLHYLRI